MASEVTLEHFKKAAREIGAHGDNDTLPFDLDNRFISDCNEDIAEVAYNLFQAFDKAGKNKARQMIDSLSIFHERLLVPSGTSGFRITTKIHPFWNVYINGLAIAISEKLAPRRYDGAHSYRHSNEGSRLFLQEHSWYSYKAATLNEPLLTESKSVVVQTDVSGFYEHIYHHRLENLIGDLFSAHSTVSAQLDRILNQMSSGRSFGLPVGGQCSRVLAEVLMHAIDELLTASGMVWHRYVDDYTLIASSQSDAYKALSSLSRYLADYGLSLNRTKTTFLSSLHYKNFVTAQLSSDDEQAGKLKEIDLYFDPYTDDPHAEYEELQKAVNEIDVVSLLQAETFKSQPDSYLVAQISRTLEFQSPHAAAQLCQTLLKPSNLNAFRASWSKIMRGIAKIRADERFTTIHSTIDFSLDDVIQKCEHLLLPEANCLHFMRAIRFKETPKRSIFVQDRFNSSEFVTIKRASVDCWRHWKSRSRFLSASNSYDTSHEELQRMFWLASYQFGDEGNHFRGRVKKKIEHAWALGFESEESKTFSELYKGWSTSCGF
ncbi:Reverse transcriptase (RNA-dependent DNA polymerase) [Vibrio xiamenensis]|uniref:Reverse transcriptase (RNA-dependent DNA polymerase) n=1 Tax=Vibrio xiamenensis TaxID=861298 RepID=A0A1G8G4N8_9VIBR|nr:RNA-directed DNA polymerase [Vibrio xiamenensis]SDH89319.1 Reverse transcriptase (RNA-dependent DNA polymerase) [Vibrio xiamenensis]